MIKKVILMLAVGLVSFSGAFIFAWLTHSPPESPPGQSEEPPVTDGRSQQGLSPSETDVAGLVTQDSAPTKKSMTEQQLKDLIRNVRGKMREYERKLQNLEVQEQRLQVAQEVLREDIGNLNNLRIELASTIAKLRSERDSLLSSRLEIEKSEKVNLVSIAATYDKMDSSSASTILTNMCKDEQEQNIEAGKAYSSFDDAVKILHYMTERTKAKLLAELATSEPALAASLCNRLKQIVERD
jgi:flagellar motility protein MotE (MotC chaperone)